MNKNVELVQHLRDAWRIQHDNGLPILCLTMINNKLFICNNNPNMGLMLSELLNNSHVTTHEIVRTVCNKLGITEHVNTQEGLTHVYAVIDGSKNNIACMGIFTSMDLAMEYASRFGFSVDVVDMVLNCGLYDK